jgi:hypothetical protein
MASVARAGIEFDGVNDAISRDFASATQSGNTKFTLAFWYEGGVTIAIYDGVYENLTYVFASTTGISFQSGSNEFEIVFEHEYATAMTGPTFVMLSFDSTQATAANRVRLWTGPYEGVIAERTLDDQSPIPMVQNATVLYNELHEAAGNTADKIADFYFLDGIAITDPATFVDSPSVDARAKDYTGSFGNLGYHLDFATSGDLGNDVSGNANDFTVVGAPVRVSPYLETVSSITLGLAATETSDALSGAIAAAHTAALDATETSDIPSVGLTSAHTAGLSVTETSDAASFGLSARHTSDLAATEAADTALILCFDGIALSLLGGEARDTASVQLNLVDLSPAALAATETRDAASVQLTVINPATAVLDATEQRDIAVFSDANSGFVVAAPSYSYWRKTKDKNKPTAPKLPDPVQPGEVVIDDAVIRQTEEERLAALVFQAKQDALRRLEEMRARDIEKKPSRKVRLKKQVQPPLETRKARTMKLARGSKVEKKAEAKARVIKLPRPMAPSEPLVKMALNYIALKGLAPRRAPSREIAKARTVSLRRSRDQAQPEMRR